MPRPFTGRYRDPFRQVDAEQGETHYRKALTHQAARRALLIAHCYLGLGKLYKRTSKGEQARRAPITATTMYREMDMRFG